MVPGKQNIPIWLTLVIGVVAALIGTFIASAEAVSLTGATPRFADVDPDTHLITAAHVEVDVAQGNDSAEALGDVFDAQDVSGARHFSKRRGEAVRRSLRSIRVRAHIRPHDIDGDGDVLQRIDTGRVGSGRTALINPGCSARPRRDMGATPACSCVSGAILGSFLHR